jgi:hypothetical protein
VPRCAADGDDYGVVGVAEHRNEIGNQVYRHRQLGQQQTQPYPHQRRPAPVNGQAAQQP